jgi:hypothetical protein
MRDELQTARHESGHVISAISCGLTIDYVTIIPAKGYRGYVRLAPEQYTCKPLREFSDNTLHELRRPPLPKIEGQALRRDTCILLYAYIINRLAGSEAERLFFPYQPTPPMNASNDIKAATYMAGCVTGKPAALLDLARNDAAKMLAVRKHQIEAVADALMIERTLTGAAIDEILAGVSPAMRAERARRKEWAAITAGAEAFRLAHGTLQMLRV